MAHIPGPWTLEYGEYAGYDMMSGGWVINDPTGGWIVVVDRNKDDAEGEATARLIAAAPDLLEALKAEHDAIDVLFAMLIEKDKTFLPTKSRAWVACVQGHAAITKATGGQSDA